MKLTPSVRKDLKRQASEGEGREPGGRELYLHSRLLKRTVLVARAQTALYLAAGLFSLSLGGGGELFNQYKNSMLDDADKGRACARCAEGCNNKCTCRCHHE
jgi:hypothetical protein